MKNKEIVGMTDKELIERIDTEQSNLRKMKINHAVSPLDNPHRIEDVKRDIARLKTELRKRELNAVNTNK